jgi:hypothetical protein
MRFLCRNPKHIDKRVDFKCLKMHNKKKEDGIYITVRSKGLRSRHKHQLMHVSKM